MDNKELHSDAGHKVVRGIIELLEEQRLSLQTTRKDDYSQRQCSIKSDMKPGYWNTLVNDPDRTAGAAMLAKMAKAVGLELGLIKVCTTNN